MEKNQKNRKWYAKNWELYAKPARNRPFGNAGFNWLKIGKSNQPTLQHWGSQQQAIQQGFCHGHVSLCHFGPEWALGVQPQKINLRLDKSLGSKSVRVACDRRISMNQCTSSRNKLWLICHTRKFLEIWVEEFLSTHQSKWSVLIYWNIVGKWSVLIYSSIPIRDRTTELSIHLFQPRDGAHNCQVGIFMLYLKVRPT
jgi:hypothetical protein